MTVRSSHNFVIGDLGFHKLLDNEQHVYERATAPFRKEQFDAAPTVGDQSLAGWWTRGQLSFHKGAGVKYYEVLDGDEVLNTFRSSVGVNPFTPGRVTLDPEPQAATTSLPGTVTASRSSDTGLLLLSGGVAYRTNFSDTPSALTASGSVDTIASGPGYDYLATATPKGIDRVTSTGLSGTQIYSHTQPIKGMWWAKDRLWVLDTEGDLFAVPHKPSGTLPVPLGTPQVSLGRTIAYDAASLASTPGDVYFTDGSNTIYRISLDADGAVPTLAAPLVAAELPKGEKVKFIRYYLGFLVIVTSQGTRVGLVQQQGLVFGPLLMKWRATRCRSVAARGTSVYVTGATEDDDKPEVVYEIALGEIGPNEVRPPWRVVRTITADITGAVNPAAGAFEHFGALVFAEPASITRDRPFGGGDTYAREVSGSLTTGFHRFGTLEGKHFSGVKVRAGGDGGKIKVYLVEQSGTETLLGTVDAATADGADVSLVTSAPAEAMGLKFVLERSTTDATVGPELLGYQIKALPSPLRQRLIRVPLMMFDVERGPTGRSIGKEKDAWVRLEALESLEENDALVSFEDKDTGETGTVYIESVELTQKNGSRGRSKSNGFGGVVTVTLRKVA